MKVKILRPTQGDGKDLEPGKVVDLTDATARKLVGMGKAEMVRGGKSAPAAASDVEEKTLDTTTAAALVP